MPVEIHCKNIVLTPEEVTALWRATIEYCGMSDDVVGVQCVDENEIAQLNATYRKKNKPTNVLTFSYGEGEHDVALCLPVIEREAVERSLALRDYTALVLVHAYLHVCGMDHERSQEEEEKTHVAEQHILKETGYTSIHL